MALATNPFSPGKLEGEHGFERVLRFSEGGALEFPSVLFLRLLQIFPNLSTSEAGLPPMVKWRKPVRIAAGDFAACRPCMA